MNNTNDRSLSVIVPVYNSSEYLKECIESIINSNIEGMEIILVDDGSKDDSYEICRQLAQVDDRIIVYQKENGGSASARNYGLMRATGSYIAFFDSDDTAVFVMPCFCTLSDTVLFPQPVIEAAIIAVSINDVIYVFFILFILSSGELFVSMIVLYCVYLRDK